MKKFFQNAFTKLKDYFTANVGRKIFFFGTLVMLVGFTLYACLRFALLNSATWASSAFIDELMFATRMIALLAGVVAGAGTLWDSMYSRYLFLKKIRDIQYEHLKAMHEKESQGEIVDFTPTFSEEEKKYLRRRKWGFVFIILFKVGLVIALFSLLLNV